MRELNVPIYIYIFIRIKCSHNTHKNKAYKACTLVQTIKLQTTK